jgi:hypothetical protein
MSPAKKAAPTKKSYDFLLTRSMTQEGRLSIDATSGKEAEAILQKRREEDDSFDDAEWDEGDLQGPIDYETDFDADEEED